MKKLFLSMSALVLLMSCSSTDDKRFFVSNRELNVEASRYINNSTNLVFGNYTIKNLETKAIEGSKIYSKLEYSSSIFGLYKDSGTVEIITGLKLVDNKLYLDNPEIVSVNSDNKEIKTAITSVIVNGMAYGSLYDFKDKIIEDISIGKGGIVFFEKE